MVGRILGTMAEVFHVACKSSLFVIVPEAHVEGSSATCGIEVGNFRVLFIALFRGNDYF
jgi:hypothetical protein